jgi:hypothetical protein
VLHDYFLQNHKAAALVAIQSTQKLKQLPGREIQNRARRFLKKGTKGFEKTDIIIEVNEGRPVFQYRTLAEYLAATWLCDNIQNCKTFMRDHLFESELIRGMVERILADKCKLLPVNRV